MLRPIDRNGNWSHDCQSQIANKAAAIFANRISRDNAPRVVAGARACVYVEWWTANWTEKWYALPRTVYQNGRDSFNSIYVLWANSEMKWKLHRRQRWTSISLSILNLEWNRKKIIAFELPHCETNSFELINERHFDDMVLCDVKHTRAIAPHHRHKHTSIFDFFLYLPSFYHRLQFAFSFAWHNIKVLWTHTR